MSSDADNQMDSFPISVLCVGLRLWGAGATREGLDDMLEDRGPLSTFYGHRHQQTCWCCKQIAAASLG